MYNEWKCIMYDKCKGIGITYNEWKCIITVNV